MEPGQQESQGPPWRVTDVVIVETRSQPGAGDDDGHTALEGSERAQRI